MLRNVFKDVDPVQWLRNQRKLSRRLRAAKKGVVGVKPAKELEHALALEALAERYGDADHTVGGIHDEVAEEIELKEGNEPDDSDILTPVMGMRKYGFATTGQEFLMRKRSEHHHRPWWLRRTRVTPRRMALAEHTPDEVDLRPYWPENTMLADWGWDTVVPLQAA